MKNIFITTTAMVVMVTAPTATAATTTGDYLASPSKEILEKAISYCVAKDFEALQKLMDAKLVFMLKSGVEVEIVETKVFSGLVKIRPRGQTIELWTVIEGVK